MSRANRQVGNESAAQAIIAALQGKIAEWRADPTKAQTTGWELPLLSGSVEDTAARNFQGEGDPAALFATGGEVARKEAARKMAKALANRKGAKNVTRE